ncbi:MAG: hypothetical protein DHS20C15_10250 [Planctomycetota bacterium]|nr:MAG: hypothetical protein DHS20C15_10250 [Planctomycetota bacterium]
MLGLLLPALLVMLAPFAAGQDKPKTIVLGFDGMDQALTSQYIDEGLLPNLKKLRDGGLFQRLETSNPAQSPVSWAVFNTGQNPGKTGVGGFVSRFFSRDANGARTGGPMPKAMLGDATTIDASEFIELPFGMTDPVQFTRVAAGGALLLVFLLAKQLLRLNVVIALVLGLGAAFGGWTWASGMGDTLPADGKLPYEINPMQGTNFWTHLDAAGVRMMGVQVASTFPPDNEGPNTKLLSGLGVKDISNSPGSWSIYTDDVWSLEKSTGSGGRIRKMYFDERDGLEARAELVGPKNWFETARFKHDIDVVEQQLAHRDNSEGDVQALEDRKRELESEYEDWRRSNEDTKVSFSVVSNDEERSDGKVTIEIAGQKLPLEVGDWTDFTPIEFVFGGGYSAHAIVRFHLMAAGPDEVRLFVPPIQVDPYQPLPYLPISAPPGFSREIAEGIGDHYETLGWACMTNPLKDQKDTDFSPQSFLDDIVSTEAKRVEILNWAMERPQDWDLYYQVFSTTDRIGHMLFREYDTEHPAHDPEYAAQTMHAWGREFPLGRALPEVYKEADRIVGGVLDRIEAGEFGDDCLLLIVADHGFTSFRWGVNLNNALMELGFLVPKAGKNGETLPLDELKKQGLLGFVDWSKSKAYSMGLGKIFINLEGREPSGIVKQEDYDATVAEIQAALMEMRHPETGDLLVTSASKTRDIFHGPWVVHGKHEQYVRGVAREVEHDGMADIFLGFSPYHRVSWNNTMGGLDSAVVTPNTNHWSGGHVSVDPAHVAGVFLSNRALQRPDITGLIDVGPTLLARYGVDEAEWAGDTGVDGHVIPFENLQR